MSILTAILVVINVITYSMMKRVLERQFGLAAQSVAMTVALMISEDLDNYRDFLNTRDVTSKYYQHMQNYFDKIKNIGNIRFIYTINRLDETHTEFILDAEPIGSPDYSAPGDIEEENRVTLRVFNTGQPAVLEPTHSPFGILLGSSAPITDENGDVIGVAGVDLDNSVIFSSIQRLFIVIVVMCILLLILIYFLLSKVSHFFLEPMLKDKLTGAYNRRYFEPLLQNSIDIALKTNQDLSVLMLDLDHFKKINDTYGHLFGDIVLAKITGIIRDCLRKEDFIFRYGGEEFVVVLFNLDSAITKSVAERIRLTIESHEILNEKENIPVKVTISIGIADLRKRKIPALELVTSADKALYTAKETRNAVAVSPL
jgi:diguanylate cyclase (GGDEF)-like protein